MITAVESEFVPQYLPTEAAADTSLSAEHLRSKRAWPHWVRPWAKPEWGAASRVSPNPAPLLPWARTAEERAVASGLLEGGINEAALTGRRL